MLPGCAACQWQSSRAERLRTSSELPPAAHAQPADKSAIDVRDFTADSEGTQALLSGQVNAQVTDAAVAKTAVDSNPGNLAITSKELLFPVPVGLAVNKGNAALEKQLGTAFSHESQRHLRAAAGEVQPR